MTPDELGATDAREHRRTTAAIALFYAALVVCVLYVVGDPGQPAACPPGEASGPPVSSADTGAGPDAGGGC